MLDRGIVGNKERGNHDRWKGNSPRPDFCDTPFPPYNGEVDVYSHNVRQSYDKVDETVPEPHVLSEDNEELLADQKVSIPYKGGNLIDVRNRFGNPIFQETAQ